MGLTLALGLGIAGGAGGFSPLQLPNLKAWWRADLGITTSSGNVTSWADQSGNAVTLSPGTAPVYNATDAKFGGKPAVQIGAGMSLVGTLTVAQPLTVIIATYNTTSGAGSQMFGGNVSRVDIGKDSSNHFYMFAGSVVSSTVGDANAHAIAFVANGASSALYVDNSASAAATGNPGADSLQNPIVSNFPGTGADAEVIICSGVLSAANISSVFRYMSAAYGFPAS